MKILFVTSEAGPYAASGGLGDVMGALPKAIADNKELSCEVIMPLYDTMKEEYRSQLELVCDIKFDLSWRHTGASIYKINNSGVTYYFVENHYYFDRKRLYGEFDDGERFAFFSMAVIEFMLNMGNIPDILHANDWQSAAAIVYLKTKYAHLDAFSNLKTVYTIHNIEYQGKFDPYILGDVYGIDSKYRDLCVWDGALNLMKAAMVLSDFVTTVSPNYASELEYDFFAFGLAPIVKSIKHKMDGVINGIDYSYFSPEVGGDIYQPFTKTNYKTGKQKNKKALCEEIGLPYKKDTPLFVMITRLASQKGIDLLLAILDELLMEDIQLVILGTGEKEYENALLSAQSRHDNLKALITFDRVLSKKMYAAADVFLMPSKSEPCGLAQMICCSYATIPVVRSVGGLKDSIIPYGVEGANGFRFDNYNAHELLFTAKQAAAVYKNKEEWNALTKSAKASNFTWNNSAAKYIQIYKNLLS
ncbi:MAG: glycogen synthase [Clostridia bacterium]|nr:glycogen synthase [Clostridia bacterium]